MRKRASKRLTRPGGVIARARKSIASSAGVTPVAAKRVHAPAGGFCGAPWPQTPMASPVSSKVSRIAASASALAKLGDGRRTRALSFSSTLGSSAPAAHMRRSSGSTRPPGKTNLPGMNLCPACRLPISTRATSRARTGQARSRLIAVRAEAVHAHRPLLTDDRALRARQDEVTRDHGHRQPKCSHPEERRIGPYFIGKKDAGADPMGDDQQRHVSRRVVRAVMAEVLAADLAGIDDLEIGAEQRAPATGRTTSDQATR